MVVSKNKLLIELINKQRTEVDANKKLDIKDLHRICKNLNNSIFQNNNGCCLWCGYVTNISNSNTKYINFFFKKKKYALHRLLYENFVGNIDKSEYLRFTCDNKGVCCNLNHITKIVKKNESEDESINDSILEINKEEKYIDINESEKYINESESDKCLKNDDLHLDDKKDNNENKNSIEVIKSKSQSNLNKLVIVFK